LEEEVRKLRKERDGPVGKEENTDVLIKLVRDSNNGKELGRQAGCRVIGYDDYVKGV